MNRFQTATLGAAFALLLAPISAQAQQAPISVRSCTVQQYQFATRRQFWYWETGPGRYGSVYTDGLKISYVNTSPKVANRVAFLVNYRGDVQHVIDVGTFSPGAGIEHSFGEFSGLAHLGPKPNVCKPIAVRFADGSVWHAPGFPRVQSGN